MAASAELVPDAPATASVLLPAPSPDTDVATESGETIVPSVTPSSEVKAGRKKGKKKRGKKKRTSANSARLLSLYNDAAVRKKKIEERRESLDAEHTYKPHITKKANSQALSPSKRAERLYLDAAKRKESQRAKAAKLPSECTFAPKLTGRGKGAKKRRPLYEANVLQQRDKAREALRKKLDEEDDSRVNSEKFRARRRSGAGSGARGKTVMERMRAAEERRQQNLAAMRKARDQDQMKECTFRPSTSPTQPGEGQKRKSTGRSGAGGAIFDRLYKNAGEARAKREALQEASAADSKYTFRPQIRGLDGKLKLASKKKDNREWIERQVEAGTKAVLRRRTDKGYRERYEEREMQAAMAECTFAPSITSPGSPIDHPTPEPEQADSVLESPSTSRPAVADASANSVPVAAAAAADTPGVDGSQGNASVAELTPPTAGADETF